MTLIEHANRIAKAATPQDRIPLGPWKGSMRSVSADLVPPEYMAESDADTPSSNYAYNPLTGTWKRRKGTTQKFDSFASPVGMLPAKWSSKCRQLEEFKSASMSDNIPTTAALLTRETVTTGLDDGRFSTFWYRDQIADLNYTLGSEFSATTYPPPGAVASVFSYTPLWYDSGDGGITRGANEFSRRFFLSGSRKFLQVGNWWYFPSFLGTPSRWSGTKAVVGATPQFARPSSTVSNGSAIVWGDQSGGTTDLHLTIDDAPGTAGDTDYISHSKQGGLVVFQLPAMDDPGVTTGHILRIRARVQPSSNTNEHLTVTLSVGGGSSILTNDIGCPTQSAPGSIPGEVCSSWTGNTRVSPNSAEISTSFTTYSYTLTATEVALIGGDYSQFRVGLAYYTGFSAIETIQVSSVEMELPGAGGATASTYAQLIPSGPLPPLHAGTIAAGTLVEDTTSYCRPDADVTDGAWLNQAGSATNLYQSIDEVTIDDTDYIKATATSTCEIGLGDFGFVPAQDEQVELLYRASKTVNSGTGNLTVYLMEGANIRASEPLNTTLTTSFYTYGFTLSASEVSSITDWTNLRVQFISSIASNQVNVSFAALAHYASAATTGGWRGSDRFYYSMAYRFEDDSVWMPCVPRGPNATLPNGYNLATVNSSNTSASYDSVIHSNLPVPPFGCKKKIILRSPKINSTTDSTLQLNVRDLRIVAEIDPGVTTYVNTFADDDSLVPDVDSLFIRQDHIMPPRARYIFGGDSRVCHSYGSFNPSAIILAPVGRAADYDLNLADTAAALYTQNSFYVRIALDSSSVATLTLNESDGTTNTAISFALADADLNTLEKVVDKINATSFAVNGQQWRAQLAPGVDGAAVSTTSLLPHTRAIDSCVVAAQEITKAAGGLSKAAVGDWISGTGATLGAYVSIINSDTKLTFVGTITAGTKTLNFYKELGDAPTTATANSGYQRVIANSLPGFLYFNKTYLNQFATEKSTVWMTVASPGSIKSAANCFSGKTANKHVPPRNIGISMGGAAVDNGFVVPFGNGNASIRNTRDSGTGVDADYKLFVLNEARGCCSPAGVVAGNRFAMFFSPEGWIACELFNESLMSEAIWRHPTSDAVTGTGDFSYEAPLCIAATAADDDTAYLSARILRSALWVNYRASGSHPNRQVVYDFSAGHESNGINALFRSPGQPWGWGVPLVRSVTALTEGRRVDGTHLYGWNEANAGSTGDGRIDELETSDTDNGTAITASITTPWFEFGSDNLSAQEITAWHTSPTGATVALDFHRSRSDETYTLTPNTSSAAVIEDLKMLTLPARAVTDACYLGWSQSVGPAGELRKLELRAKRARDYR